MRHDRSRAAEKCIFGVSPDLFPIVRDITAERSADIHLFHHCVVASFDALVFALRRKARFLRCSSFPKKDSFDPSAALQAQPQRLRCTTIFFRDIADICPFTQFFIYSSSFFFLKYFLKFLIALRVDYTSDKENYQ